MLRTLRSNTSWKKSIHIFLVIDSNIIPRVPKLLNYVLETLSVKVKTLLLWYWKLLNYVGKNSTSKTFSLHIKMFLPEYWSKPSSVAGSLECEIYLKKFNFIWTKQLKLPPLHSNYVLKHRCKLLFNGLCAINFI